MYLHQNFSIELVLCSATIFASLAFVSRFELCQTLLLSLMCVVEVPHNTRRDENTGAKALCVTALLQEKRIWTCWICWGFKVVAKFLVLIMNYELWMKLLCRIAQAFYDQEVPNKCDCALIVFTGILWILWSAWFHTQRENWVWSLSRLSNLRTCLFDHVLHVVTTTTTCSEVFPKDRRKWLSIPPTIVT